MGECNTCEHEKDSSNEYCGSCSSEIDCYKEAGWHIEDRRDEEIKQLQTEIDRLKELQHEYDSTRGLWCIDRDPKEVDIEWIRKNSFQLKGAMSNPELTEKKNNVQSMDL